jgi:hypothetical protein
MANAPTRQTRNSGFRLTKVLVSRNERGKALPRFEFSFNTLQGNRNDVFLSTEEIDSLPDLQTALEDRGYRATAAICCTTARYHPKLA